MPNNNQVYSDRELHDIASYRTHLYGSGTKSGEKNDMGLMDILKANSQVFGAPPQFNHMADPRWYKEYDIGRVYAKTYMVAPSILSMAPIGVQFSAVGGAFDQTNSDKLKQIIEQAAGNKLKPGDFEYGTDKLYHVTYRYNEYINTVNYCLRLISIYLGIDRRKYPGSAETYRSFDWASKGLAASKLAEQMRRPPGTMYAHYDSGGGVSNFRGGSFESLFDDTATYMSDIQNCNFINFYLNSDGTSINESASITTSQSMIASQMNQSLGGLAKEINFLLGTKYDGSELDEGFDLDFNNLLQNEKIKGSGFLEALFKTGRGYLGGAKLIFPEIIDECRFDKSMTVNLKFVSPYGDTESIYLYCFAPLIHILPFAFPQQYDRNMYTFPFLVKATCKGFFNSDVCVMSNFQFTKGGPDNKSYNASGLPTEIDVSFDLTPMYSELMLPNPLQPKFASFNSALHEYLAVLSGIDLSRKNYDLEYETAKLTWGQDALLSAFITSAYRNTVNYFGDIGSAVMTGVAQGVGIYEGLTTDTGLAQSIGLSNNPFQDPEYLAAKYNS